MQISKRRNRIVADDGPIPLTIEGLKRLREKLARLKRILPDLALEAQRTAAYGDRSDNAEYKEAKSTLRRTQLQIWTIEDQLRRAVPISTEKNTSGKIQLGSTVLLELGDGTQSTYEVVGPFETNPARGRISHKSPLGVALGGHKKGDVITIQTPKGSREYRVLEIS